MLRLVRTNRVLFTRSLSPPREVWQDEQIDAAFIDWKMLATRIVSDIDGSVAPRAGAPRIVEARWLPRVAARSLAPEF